MLPLLRADLGITDVQARLIASVFTAVLALTVPVAGYVGDVFNRAKIVTLSLFGWSLSTLLSGFGASFGYLVVVRSIATGAGEAFYAPAANALIAEHHSETRARALSIQQTSLYVGVIVSGLVSGFIADRFGWRASFWVFGLCGVVLAVLVGLRLRPARGAPVRVRTPAPPLRQVFAVLRRPTVILLMVAFDCMVFVNIGFLTWMPTFLHEQFGLSFANAGFSSIAYHHVGAFAGVMFGGFPSDRLAARQPHRRLVLQAVGLLAAAPFIWLLGTPSPLAALYGALAVFGFFRGVYDAGIYAGLLEVIEPRLRSSVLLGYLKGDVGLAGSFVILAGVYVVGGAALLLAAKVFFATDRLRGLAGDGATGPDVLHH